MNPGLKELKPGKISKVIKVMSNYNPERRCNSNLDIDIERYIHCGCNDSNTRRVG